MADFDRRTGAALSNYESALQSVETILFTRLGAFVLLRHFGGGVLELLGRLGTPRLFAAYRLLLAAAIDLWEPRFRVRRVLVSGSAEEIRLGRFGVTVEVDWRPNALLGDETVEEVRRFGYDFTDGKARRA